MATPNIVPQANNQGSLGTSLKAWAAAYALALITNYTELTQSAAPTTPTSAIRIFADTTNRLAVKGANGFVSTLSFVGNTADRLYTLPDKAGTVFLNTTIVSDLGALPSDQSGAIAAGDTLLVALGRIEQNRQNTALLNGASFTGAVSVTGAPLTIDRIVVNQTVQAYSASTTLDFNAGTTWIALGQLTGNITFATSNKAAGRELSIKINSDSSLRTFTFPGWTWVGGLAPASIAANKTAVLTLRCFDTTEGGIIASYAVQS